MTKGPYMDDSNDRRAQSIASDSTRMAPAMAQAKASLQPPQPSAAPAQAPAPSQAPAQAASSSAAPGVPVKAAPASKNPSMSSAPSNAPFPSTQGADPWARHQPRSQ